MASKTILTSRRGFNKGVFSHPIHRVPNKITQVAMDSGNHRTYITPVYLNRAFKDVRDRVNTDPV